MTSDPRWLQLLRNEAERTSIGQAAKRIDYSRATVSLALAGKYTGDLGKLESKVLAVMDGAVDCPHLRVELPAAMCREYAAKRAPTHNPMAMPHWRACRECQYNCNGGT